MSIFLLSASSEYFQGTLPGQLPTTGYPLFVGMWVGLATGGSAATIWALSDTGTTSNYLSIRKTAGDLVSIVGRAGASENVATVGSPALSVGLFAFVLGRFVSSASRTISIFAPGTSTIFNFASTTTTRAPTGLDALTIGALSTSGGITEPWDGLLAEYWLSNIDPLPGITAVAAASNNTIAALALGGPFSFPHMRHGIIEYWSWRKGFDVVADYRADNEDVYWGKWGQTFWFPPNGHSINYGFQHPDLPYWYRKPIDRNRPCIM